MPRYWRTLRVARVSRASAGSSHLCDVFRGSADLVRVSPAVQRRYGGLLDGWQRHRSWSDALEGPVRDEAGRGTVESVQGNPGGKLFYDASAGSRFGPNNAATKLVTAVALVKAAGLDSQAATSTLPISVIDGLTIPAEYRGYVAVALQKGLMLLDGNKFNASRPLTRIELAQALNAFINL